MSFAPWSIFPLVGILGLVGLRSPRVKRSWFAFQCATSLLVGTLCLGAALLGIRTATPVQVGGLCADLMLAYWIQHELRRPTNYEMVVAVALFLVQFTTVASLVQRCAPSP